MKREEVQSELVGIVEKLKKYPFIEKMTVCQQCAIRLMKITHLDIFNTPNVVYPWELEVFAELSLFSEAPIATCSFENSDAAFVDMINIIRNYQHPYLQRQKNMNFADAFLMVTAIQQFKTQENIYDRLYRYNYFWNFVNDKIDMSKVFSEHFDGLPFSEFRNLGMLIFFYASLKETTVEIYQRIIAKYIKTVGFLKITREDYNNRQSEKIDKNYENTIYGFNYLRPYPFVELCGYIFLPLPFLIIDAVTESLLTRVTIDDNSLREKIGREVAQSYIVKIFDEGKLYDQVLPESEYYIGRQRIDSPDVMIKKKTQVCFIDTKLSTPKLEIRKFNVQAIEETVLRCAKSVIQIYNRVKDFNNGVYYPFSEKISIDRSHVFGIVALLEDSYVSRRKIYERVFFELNIKDDSDEAMYIKSNIKITNFRDLELFAFRSHDIFVALESKKNDPKQWNMGLFNDLLFKNDKRIVLPSLDDFIELNRSIIVESANEFVDVDLVRDN